MYADVCLNQGVNRALTAQATLTSQIPLHEIPKKSRN